MIGGKVPGGSNVPGSFTGDAGAEAPSSGQPVTGAAGEAGAADPASLPFDAALAALQDVVARLETGGLPLEVSLLLYERGVALHARCARLLDDAELRVQRLVEQAGGRLRTVDLTVDDADEDPAGGA